MPLRLLRHMNCPMTPLGQWLTQSSKFTSLPNFKFSILSHILSSYQCCLFLCLIVLRRWTPYWDSGWHKVQSTPVCQTSSFLCYRIVCPLINAAFSYVPLFSVDGLPSSQNRRTFTRSALRFSLGKLRFRIKIRCPLGNGYRARGQC